MITKQELQKRLKESLEEVQPRNVDKLKEKILQHMQFVLENYDNLSVDAQEVTDKMIETFQEQLGTALEKLPDSKEKRKLKRLHAGTLGKRFLIEEVIKSLDSSPVFKEKTSQKFSRIFHDRLQNIADFQFDICHNTLSGPALFSQMSLLGMCVDELIVILHLAQHHYTNQVYSHIRTVIENTDKMELFRIKPEWAVVWCSEDAEKIRKELSPSKVRKKLGQSKYDPLYGVFSVLGPHTSFRAVKTKTFRNSKSSSKGNPQIVQWLGGCPTEYHTMFVYSFSLYVLNLVLMQLIKSFGHFLNREEVNETLNQTKKEIVDYFKHDFLPCAKRCNLDVTELEDFVKNGPWAKIK